MPKLGKAPADLERGLIHAARKSVTASAVHDTLAMALDLACPSLDISMWGIVASYLSDDHEYKQLPTLGAIARSMKKNGAAMMCLTHAVDSSFLFAVVNGPSRQIHFRAARGFHPLQESIASSVDPALVADWAKLIWPQAHVDEPQPLPLDRQPHSPLWIAQVKTDDVGKRLTPAVSRIASSRAVQRFLVNCLVHPTVRCQWYRNFTQLPAATPPHAVLTLLATESLLHLSPTKPAVRPIGAHWANHYIANIVAIPGFVEAYRTKWGVDSLCCTKCKSRRIFDIRNTNPLLCKLCISSAHLQREFVLDVDNRAVIAWDLSSIEQLR